MRFKISRCFVYRLLFTALYNLSPSHLFDLQTQNGNAERNKWNTELSNLMWRADINILWDHVRLRVIPSAGI